MSSYQPPPKDDKGSTFDPGNHSEELPRSKSLYDRHEDEIKYWLKIGTGIGLTGLELGGAGYEVDKSVRDSDVSFIPGMALEYSEELTEATSYSFEAINSILG